MNHSKQLTQEQIAELQRQTRIPLGEEFAGFSEDSAEGLYIKSRLDLLTDQTKLPRAVDSMESIPIPQSLGSQYRGQISTQQALGTLLTGLSRKPEVAARIVTTSPDVAISTNLGGWINKMGVYCQQESTNFFRENSISLMLNWEQSPRGHHLELGISENDLFLLLNMLGLSKEFTGGDASSVGNDL